MERFPKGEKVFISAPYIGRNYEDSRILFLGKNINGNGEFETLNLFFNQERDKINRNITNAYIWAAILGQIPLKLLRILPKEYNQYNLRDISQAKTNYIFDLIAFDNIVKCSPEGKRAELVNNNMWGNCISLILVDIIKILSPNIIFCFTKGSSDHLIENSYFSGFFTIFEKKYLKIRKRAKEPPRIIVETYHPAYFKFNKLAPRIISDIESILKSNM